MTEDRWGQIEECLRPFDLYERVFSNTTSNPPDFSNLKCAMTSWPTLMPIRLCHRASSPSLFVYLQLSRLRASKSGGIEGIVLECSCGNRLNNMTVNLFDELKVSPWQISWFSSLEITIWRECKTGWKTCQQQIWESASHLWYMGYLQLQLKENSVDSRVSTCVLSSIHPMTPCCSQFIHPVFSFLLPVTKSAKLSSAFLSVASRISHACGGCDWQMKVKWCRERAIGDWLHVTWLAPFPLYPLPHFEETPIILEYLFYMFTRRCARLTILSEIKDSSRLGIMNLPLSFPPHHQWLIVLEPRELVGGLLALFHGKRCRNSHGQWSAPCWTMLK